MISQSETLPRRKSVSMISQSETSPSKKSSFTRKRTVCVEGINEPSSVFSRPRRLAKDIEKKNVLKISAHEMIDRLSKNVRAETIEMSCGELVTARSQEDSWDAVMDGKYIIFECPSCSRRLVCSTDSKYIHCPKCHAISPCFLSLIQTENFVEPFGVSLGLTVEECGNMLLPKD